MFNFLQRLPKPFFCLAPMEDVTDTVFRQMIIKAARPDVFFTEFVNVEGMFSEGAEIVNQRLKFTKQELPLVAQLWGLNPENFYRAAQQIVQLGFSGIDINMGCPQRKVIKKGACAALIKNPKLAKEIIQAVKEGISSAVRHSGKRTELFVSASRIRNTNDSGQAGMTKKIPLSVKTRIGFDKIITKDWIGFLLEQGLDAITVHGRTAKEQSLVPAHWDEIANSVKLRNQMKVRTLIIGNGDVKDISDGLAKFKHYGVDGIAIGRGIFHNFWAFDKSSGPTRSPIEKIQLLIQHLKLWEDTWQATKSFSLMKKYFKIYINGFAEAAKIRQSLMECNSYENAILEINRVVRQFKLLGT